MEGADAGVSHFSPSQCHRQLMERTRQALRYRGGDVRAWQRKLRAKVRELVMSNLPAKRVPLRARSLWRRAHPLGTLEKIVFTGEPCASVNAFVCLPRNARPPYTWFICLQGHSTGAHNSIAVDREDNAKPIQVPGDRDFGLGCMARGIAALCIEQRSFGERREQTQKARSKSMCQEATMHALMLGRTLIGERVYDVDRALDYLWTRPDVDRRRVGVMGNSGGGTISLFAAALLPRLQLAMPSCYFCTFRDSILSLYHCECNYVPGLYRWAEMADVLGLFAPKPVVVVAGKKDGIFPLRAARSEFGRLKGIYRAAGAADRCHLVVGAEGHRFYAREGWAVMRRELAGLGRGRGAEPAGRGLPARRVPGEDAPLLGLTLGAWTG
jgi:dienelactone hydrolase